MLNHSAVAVRPKQSFLYWVNSVEAGSSVKIDDLPKTLHLVPDYEEPEDAEKVLKRVYTSSAGNCRAGTRLSSYGRRTGASGSSGNGSRSSTST